MKNIIRAASTALGVSALLAGSLVMGSPAFAGEEKTGTSPVSTGCYIGSYEVASLGLNDQYSGATNIGTSQLMYSPNCGTNWTNIYGWANGYRYVGGVTRFSGYASYTSPSGYGANSGEHTPQIYAPGATCIRYSGYPYRTSDNRDVGSKYSDVC